MINIQAIAKILEDNKEGLIITDPNQPDNPVVYTNETVSQMTGYSSEEFFGRNCRFLQGTDRDQPEIKSLHDRIKNNEDCLIVINNYRKDGTKFPNLLSITVIKNLEGKVIYHVGIQRDITNEKEIDKRMKEVNFQMNQKRDEIEMLKKRTDISSGQKYDGQEL